MDGKKIAVIGAGSWGTAVAVLLSENGHNVTIRARRQEVVDAINTDHRNPHYLTDINISPKVLATTDFSEALTGAEVIVMAVPSHAIRDTAKEIAPLLSSSPFIISLAKGLEDKTYLRMTEVIASEIPEDSRSGVAVLSGPNHAEEVSKKIPSATVISASDQDTMKYLQQIFMASHFRVYTNDDIIGVEIGGASKNVIAVAAGMSDGLGYGDNTKASLMTRGLAEMSRFGLALGARASTFSGLSGMGDLIATCISRHSRNRGTGEKIAQGMTVEQIQNETTMVAEGIMATMVINNYSTVLGIDLPITKNVYEVLYERKDPRQSVIDLMERGPNTESMTK